MGKKLYVGNLSFDVNDEELEKNFSEFGEIVSAIIIKDPVSGRSKGFGFVEFSDEDSAKKAKEGMDGKEVSGRTLKVDEARVKALVAALDGVDIDKAIEKAAIAQVVAAAPAAAEKKEEHKKEEKKEQKVSEEAAAAGLGSLFG